MDRTSPDCLGKLVGKQLRPWEESEDAVKEAASVVVVFWQRVFFVKTIFGENWRKLLLVVAVVEMVDSSTWTWYYEMVKRGGSSDSEMLR